MKISKIFRIHHSNSIVCLIVFILTFTNFVTINEAQYDEFVTPRWHPIQNIIATTNGTTIRLYSADFTQLIDEYILVDEATTSLVRHGEILWSPDGTKLAISLTGDGLAPTLQVWDFDTGNLIIEIPNIVASEPFAWGINSNRIATVHIESLGHELIRIYDIPSGNIVNEFAPPTSGNISALTWSQDGNTMAFHLAGSDAGTYILDVNSEIFTKSPITLTPSVNYQLSPTGDLLAGIIEWDDTDIQVVDTFTLQIVTTFSNHNNWIDNITQINNTFVSVSWDDTTRFWNPTNGQELLQLDTGLITRPSFNPDGTLFTTYAISSMNYVIDATTGEIVAPVLVPCNINVASSYTSALISAIIAGNKSRCR